MGGARWRRLAGRSSVAALAVAMAAAAGGLAGASAASAAPAASSDSGGVWGNAQEIPGTAALNAGNATALAVSCASPGECSAGGQYAASPGNIQVFTVSEVNGTWGSAEEVPGLSALNGGQEASISSVSCATPGNCAAAGSYLDDGARTQAFVVNQVNGTWGTAIEVPGTGALNAAGDATVNSVSCGSAGNCSAGGTYDDDSGNQAFVVNEVHGTWGTAAEVPGSAALNADGDAQVESVSCASAGNCSAGGLYQDGSDADQAFVVSEVGGSWGSAEEVPGSGALNTGSHAVVDSLSCASAGNCSAGGSYQESAQHSQAFVVSQVNGTWGSAIKVPGSGALNAGINAGITSVSCAAPGDCSGGGEYTDGSAHSQAFVVNEVNGAWSEAKEVPGTGALNAGGSARIASVSCAAASDCSAGGSYRDSSGAAQAFVVSKVNGTWGNAREVPGSGALNASGSAAVNAVSCATPGDCAAAGIYADSSSESQAFVASQTDPSSTALALASAKVSFGMKQPKISVSVTPSTASGTVTVTARPAKGSSISLCSITLTSGAGSCQPSATKLNAGTYAIAAAYQGSAALSGSASRAATLTVSPATSATALTLSAASVSFQDQTAERLAVTVSPQFTGLPAGIVTVTAVPAKGHSIQVCAITLANGKGSCRLTAKRLAADSYKVTATYPGTTDFSSSTSAAHGLTITK